MNNKYYFIELIEFIEMIWIAAKQIVQLAQLPVAAAARVRRWRVATPAAGCRQPAADHAQSGYSDAVERGAWAPETHVEGPSFLR